MTEESTHEAEHIIVRWHLCVPGMKSHSGQDMKKARTSFPILGNVMRTHILFAVARRHSKMLLLHVMTFRSTKRTTDHIALLYRSKA